MWNLLCPILIDSFWKVVLWGVGGGVEVDSYWQSINYGVRLFGFKFFYALCDPRKLNHGFLWSESIRLSPSSPQLAGLLTIPAGHLDLNLLTLETGSHNWMLVPILCAS